MKQHFSTVAAIFKKEPLCAMAIILALFAAFPHVVEGVVSIINAVGGVVHPAVAETEVRK